ncbi:hypothetical protein [Arthrobacter sp. NPDC092385]|uniref:hypothetical protein n=1 Tax=Arthrobacter sp. NPDC092385 TaxID=3363943 RepID=UPI003826ECEF
MTRNPAVRAVMSAPRSVLPSLLALAGLTAIMTGILAMHVWLGGHGSTSHHLAAPTTTSNSAAVSGAAEPHASTGPGHVHEAGRHRATAVAPVTATASSAAAMDASSAAPSTPCGGGCVDEMMLGMCVLAMVVVGIAGLPVPAGRALLSTTCRRGPPALSRTTRPAPPPSLTRLCISRT